MTAQEISGKKKRTSFSRVFRHTAILLVVFMCFFADVYAAVNNLNFDFYSQENGLSSNQIHCIHQDKKGWMWFGTSQGVCRFDGYKFTVFKNDPDDSTNLKGSLVRTIFEDQKGQLWIGTENGGLNKFNREKENFQHLLNRNGQPNLKDVTITSIHEDAAGYLWVGTSEHLYRISDKFELTEIKPSNQSSFTEYFRSIVLAAILSHLVFLSF